MFKNYTLQIKPVRDLTVPMQVPLTTPTDVDEIITNVVAAAGLLMLTYVGADTLRKVIVHTATVKIK